LKKKKTEVDISWKSEDILDKPTSAAPAHTEGMSVDDIKAWQDVGDKLAEEVEDEWDEDHALDMVMNDMVKDMDIQDFEADQESRPNLLEKQPQTNIPAKGFINRPTETTSVTLEGKKGNIQRKISNRTSMRRLLPWKWPGAAWSAPSKRAGPAWRDDPNSRRSLTSSIQEKRWSSHALTGWPAVSVICRLSSLI